MELVNRKPVFITDEEAKGLLDWQNVFQVTETALLSVSTVSGAVDNSDGAKPVSSQPARTFTFTTNNEGVLLSMPGFIGNYNLPEGQNFTNEKVSTLGCKLVTSFQKNQAKGLPSIFGSIFLFNTETGKLDCILEATEITAWRTATASLVATKHLYFNRSAVNNSASGVLAIVGSGVQGRIHAIGMLNIFKFSKVYLWNRTVARAEALAIELRKLKECENVIVEVAGTVRDCVQHADVIVTATYAKQPLIELSDLKSDVHINAVGAGTNHFSELSQEIYDNCHVYIDHTAGAKAELKDLRTNIVGEVGEVIGAAKPVPSGGITVFQSLGMAVEDAVVGELIFQKYKLNNP